MNIITKQLAEKLPEQHELLINKKIDPLDYVVQRSIFKNVQHLTIHDLFYNKDLKIGTILCVKDHINRTGTNPMIGQKKGGNIEFLDITALYQFNNNGIITDCCGYKLNLRYSYPSHFLCHIAILAKSMGIEKITAFIVNVK